MRGWVIGAVILAVLASTLPAHGSQTGKASFYGPGFHGRLAADGRRFDMRRLTMAHRTAPLGSWARVTNLRNHRTVLVKVTDRGPYVRGRVADLSKAAAKRLHMIRDGIAPVRVTFLRRGRHG